MIPKPKLIRHPKFSRETGNEFAKVLRLRVKNHFQERNINKYANASMFFKTFFMLGLFLTPFVLLNAGLATNSWALFALYITSGLGMAGIGMGVGHDAIHGSYSKNKKLNALIGSSFNLIGANATVWKIQHNVLHHTYTNIEHADDDINAPFFLRFSPHAEKYWTHKYQHIYIWFFYGLATISWITTKDFVRVKRYHSMGFLNEKNEFRNALLNITAWKIIYYGFALVGPLVFLPLPWWHIVLAFLSMHFITGIIISTVFQVAHIMPSSEFPLPDNDGLIAGDWSTHQFATTANYAPNSKLFSWLIGGLNYQIEHHLLPGICHVHYKELAEIVKETAAEYGMPYSSNTSFFSAIKTHMQMLKQLGHAS